MAAGENHERMTLLDGLRGVAAALVMFSHVSAVHGEVSSIFGAAGLAVDFFFILSGFVLTLAFEKRFGNDLTAFTFLKKRIIRLWPALVVGVLLGTIPHLMTTPSLLLIPVIATALLMIPVFMEGQGYFLLNVVQWSLLFELVANLAHVLIFRRLSGKALAILGGLCGAIYFTSSLALGKTTVGVYTDTFIYGFPRVGFGYILGVLIARQWQRNPVVPYGSWKIVVLTFVSIIVAVSILPGYLHRVGELLAVFVVIPALFYGAVRTKASVKAEPVFRWLGMISYPLYAVHYPILMISGYINALAFPQSPRWVWDLIAVASIVALAHCMGMFGIWFNRKRSGSRAFAIASGSLQSGTVTRSPLVRQSRHFRGR